MAAFRNKTLYVTGFDRETTAATLGTHFEQYGPLVRAAIPPLGDYNPRSIAFVEFHDSRDAEAAYTHMNSHEGANDWLHVNWASQPRKSRAYYMSSQESFDYRDRGRTSYDRSPRPSSISSYRAHRDDTPPPPRRHSTYRDRDDEYARSRSPSPRRRSSSKRGHDDDSDYEHHRSSHSSRHRTHHHHHSSSRHSSSRDEEREAYSRSSRRGRDDVDRTESAVPSSFRTRDFYTEPVDSRSMQRDDGYNTRPRDEGYNGRRRDSGYQARGDELGRNNTVEKKEDLSIRVKGEKADDLW